jgi:formylglycine-generating enzyme required for sulfatase activity/class 3 adenylate cyclase
MSSLDIIPREESERRLAAILIADVVAYSRLMQADEEGTLSRLEEIGASIIEPKVAAHRGHIFRTMGDGLLIEFPSVVEAVLCAAEIQEELRQKGDAELPEQRIQLRIGINIGDVIRKGNDVFGTGVNIAARLESLAEPGSIYISGEAYDQVRDRPFAFDDLGMKAVKNIARLVRVYRVRPGGAAPASTLAIPWPLRIGRRGGAVAGSIISLAILVALLVLALPSLRQTTTSNTLSTLTPETPNGSDEMSAWAKIKTSDRIDELSSYLDRFPNSRYSGYARHRLNAIRSHPEITKFRDCVDCPGMVVIPPGSFTMGVPQAEIDHYGFHPGASHPLHQVRIARLFAVGEFLVTRKQYAAFAAETGHQGSGCAALPLDGTGWRFDSTLSWRDPGFAQADNHPVVCVSWDDAIAYASWLSKKTGRNYRLPSEAEWEYAARAGDAGGLYFGDAPICEFANVRDQSKKQVYSTGQFFECNSGFSNTSPVGSFPPNGFGLSDMLGNVWELVEDCWRTSYVDAPVDGTARENAPCEGRVRRGGSWNSTERFLLNAGSRSLAVPYARWDVYGFRVASDYPARASAPSKSPTIAQTAPPATSSPGVPQSDWDGTWIGSWGGQIPGKIFISGGNVVEYDYNGNHLQTVISGDTLTFGKITLTKRGPNTAAAHYRSTNGENDTELVRQQAASPATSSPGAHQSSDWDGTWIGSWGGQIPGKIIISGGNVVESDYNGNRLQTIISGNILTFGKITLTKRGPNTATAHYHSPLGEADGELVRQ